MTEKITKENKPKEEKLSAHFSFEELTRTDEEELQEKNREEARTYKEQLKKLAEFAESVRSVLGCPLTVTSAFRCEKLNKRIGGSAMSQHLFAEAIDIIPMKMSAFEAFTKIIISGISYAQIILEKRGYGHLIHISIGFKRQKMYSPAGAKYENIL